MLIQCDASALEWRTPVMLSRDPIGIEEIMSGADIHSLNQVAFELPSRLIAKIYLFRTIFRGSGWAFANDPDFNHVSADPDFWDNLNEKFYKKYSGLDRWHQKLYEIVASRQPIRGPTGREWFIEYGDDKYGNPKLPINKITNYPVQGTGADIMMIARISLANRLARSGFDALMVSTVHDSLVIDCDDKYIEEVAKMMYGVFADLPKNFQKLFNYDMIIPFACEVKYGANMTDMKKLPEEDL